MLQHFLSNLPLSPHSAFISYLDCLLFLENMKIFKTLGSSYGFLYLEYIHFSAFCLFLIIQVLSLCERVYLPTQCKAQPKANIVSNYFLLRNIHYQLCHYCFIYLLIYFGDHSLPCCTHANIF